jgi:hypothetical protein
MNPCKIIDVKETINQGATEPLTLATAKKWLKITFADDDDVITDLISEVRDSIERFCSISLINKRIECIVDLNFANNRSCIEFQLPYGPAIITTSLTDISVYKHLGNNISNNFDYVVLDTDYSLDGVEFYVFKTSIPGRYKFVYNALFPYPARLSAAFKIELTYRYENRGDTEYGTDSYLCEGARKKAQPFKIMSWL